MATRFGNTWWGNEWLRSLTHIDYENRIPRGASYARNGYVRDIKLEGNVITARVAGSRPTPYKVSITVPPFSRKQTEQFIDKLSKRPGLISDLLNRKLAPEIMDIARSCGLKIFPERWSDLKMTCNCPDWAVPCKHLAAVVYMFSREIDNNPFIVFRMHGIDLPEELEKRGITMNGMEEETEVPDIRDVVQLKTAGKVSTDAPTFRRVDFSRLDDRSEAMLMLLPDNPPFSPASNFKETYAAEMRRIKKNVQRFFAHKVEMENLFPSCSEEVKDIDTDDEFGLIFNCTQEWKVEHTTRKASLDPKRYNSLMLPCALAHISPDFLPDYRPSAIALYQGMCCALHLLAKGAVAPQILHLSDKKYIIRWIPAYTDNQVHTLMDALEEILPDALVKVRLTSRSAGKAILHQGEWLVSYFLGLLMFHLSGSDTNKPLVSFFFKSVRIPFNDVGEKEMPGGIKAWTASYTLATSDYRPVFSIEESKGGGFDLHIGVEDKRTDRPTITALSEVLDSPDYARERFRILRCFTLISSMIKEVGKYINERGKKPVHYTEQTFIPFLTQIIPAVRMLDIKVFMPKALQNLIRPKATLSLACKSNPGKGFLSMADLFAFDWKVALGKEIVSADEFMKLQAEAGSLIKFKQCYIYTDAETIQKLHDAFMKTEQLTPAQLLQAALTEEYDSAPITLSDEVRELIRELTRQETVPLPSGLHATLRPYQERGYSWMYRNMRIGFGSVLADDMGLGKTLQSITLMLKLKEEGALERSRILIIVPTGLLTNWQAEIARFAPSLTTFVYHGSNRDLKQFNSDILLTTYGVLRSDHLKLKRQKWALMFIDEAQNIKNQETAQSKAVRSIPATTHIALSGTPVENRLTEFWSIMEYANKGYLGTLRSFRENFATPIQLYNDESCATRFRKITAPFMMRRMKTDKNIISDLPDKIELDDYASLKTEQTALYNKTLEAAMAEIEGIVTTDHESLFKRQGLILQMILALKQICNHPAQFLKNGDQRIELSGKAEMLADRIESILGNGEKVLVFTQFREMGDMLVRFIEERIGTRPLFYHGGCSVKERQNMVERFQNNRTDKVFVLSLKAAGTGLNLTAASHVIHYDLWWNPAVEAQATDRAYRIGQQKNVMVHRFITKDTFEERINDMLRQKKHLADMTIASGENWIGKLSNKELREIFG